MDGIKQDSENEFTVDEKLAKEGFWITVGKASINIKQGDEGVSVSLYPLDGEADGSVAETYATNAELTKESDET